MALQPERQLRPQLVQRVGNERAGQILAALMIGRVGVGRELGPNLTLSPPGATSRSGKGGDAGAHVEIEAAVRVYVAPE